MIYIYTVYTVLAVLGFTTIYFVYGLYSNRKQAVKVRTKKYIGYMRRVNKKR